MTTTAVNAFDLTKKKAKLATVHCDAIKVGGGWKTYTPTIGNGGIVGTGVNLVAEEWRYMIMNNTLFVTGQIQKSASTTGDATGTGDYTFTLPAGCQMHGISGGTSVPLYGIGSCTLLGATLSVIGTVFPDPSTNTVLFGYASDTIAFEYWGASSNAEFRLAAAGALTFGCSFSVELLETSPILASLQP